MQFQFDIASSTNAQAPRPQPTTPESVPDLLRQMLDLQREGFQHMLNLQAEHLNHVRTMAQENLARWRNLLTRRKDEHPEFGEFCKTAYPVMEKAFVQLLEMMARDATEQGEDGLDSEFAIQEFIDRYGMKVGQLSHLMSIIGPLAEAAHQLDEMAKQQQQQQQQQPKPG
jgi:hypothetical protein